MLLDEPTNHLDMSSQEVLQEAMAQYDGTIIVVSHNRYFVDSFVNKVLEIRDGTLTLFAGNISEYLLKMEQLQAEELARADKKENSSAVSKPGRAGNGESRKQRKREEARKRQERSRRAAPWLKKLEEAESKVEEFESEKERLETQMADPELYSSEERWAGVSKAYEECKRRLDRWYLQWEAVQEKIDEIDAELGVGS
ncbi:MAG: hypothetical protein CR992_00480 [Desulfobacterales bacterium]|nr:MAG: hypothetical protein CR992_00480 [Desulfobacterales bacterium]